MLHQGTYAEIFGQRVIDLSIMQESSLFVLPLTLAMFLLGAYAWKKGYFQNSTQHMTRIRQIWFWSLVIGLLFLILQVFLSNQVDALHHGYNFAHYTGILISGPALCLFYVSSLILLMRNKMWRKLLTPLQSVGRMALTNYILQSVICTFLFYSYGLGLFNQVGPALGVTIAIIIFIIQVIGSHLWLNYFRFGPLEWLWRSLTYGKWEPIKKP